MFDEMNEKQAGEQENMQPETTQEGTNPYLAGDETPTATITAIPEENKKNSAVKVVVALAIVAVILVIAIVALICSGVFGNKKTELAEAMKATFTESGDYMKEAWAIEQYEGMFESKQFNVDADLSLPEGIGLDMTLAGDGEKSGLYMDVSKGGSSLLALEGYFEESQILLAIPDMFDYVFAVNLDTIEEDIQVMVENGMIDEYTAEELIEGLNTTDTGEISEEAAKQITDDVLATWKEFYDSVEVEEIDEKELTVNGEEQQCEGYAVLITGEQAATLMEGIVNALEENEEGKEALVSAIEAYSEDYDEMMAEFEDELDDMRESEEVLEVEVYLYDGKVAQIYCEDGEDDLSFTWNIEGGNFPLENTSIKIGSEYDGYMQLIRTGSMEDGEYRAKYEMIDEYDVSYVIDIRYTAETGEISLEFLEDDWSYVFVTGTVGKTDDSTIEIAIDALEIEEEEILSGDITITNESGDIVKPEGEEINVLTMSEEDWTNLLMEAYESLY